MKKFLIAIGVCLAIGLGITACQDDDQSFGEIVAPTNIQIDYEIVGVDAENPDGDGSGLVNFTVTADNASSYKFMFSDNTTQSSPSGVYTKQFTANGVNTYTVTVIAYGTGGSSSNTSTEVTVFSDFSDPDAEQLLTGGSSKVWYWAAALPGHLGVGPNDTSGSNYQPTYYAATPFEKAGSSDSDCLYENELTFFMDGDVMKYTLDNGGRTFFNVSYESVVGGSAGQDMCYNYDTSGERIVTLSPSNSLVAPENTRGTSMTFSDNGFMGYYIGASTYEILSLESNKMVVRAIPGNDGGLAWYHTFVTSPPSQEPADDTDYTNLVWSDEFDTNGAPDSSNWSYNLGTGDNGWGNAEQQYYTDSADNIIVEDGMLKITAKAESFMGSNYTSARIVSEDKFEFTYGKVEVRAKLPQGGGTWPAIWMLGEDYATNAWPGCGEIDIMEHVGNDQGTIHGTLHYPGNSGGNANSGSTSVADVSDAFHVYKVIWSPDGIRFFVDDQEAFHTVANSTSLPFNSDFFLILNVAMGGNFGGTIDSGFTESTMEIDYVRVYQ